MGLTVKLVRKVSTNETDGDMMGTMSVMGVGVMMNYRIL